MMSRLLSLLMLTALLPGCTHKPAEGEAVKDACDEKNDGKEVSVSGYITMSKTLTMCSSNGCPFYLQQKRSKVKNADQSVRVSFPEGESARQLEPLPKSYSDSDVVFRDDDEKTFGVGDAIRVTGKLNASDGSCAMYKPKSVEKL